MPAVFTVPVTLILTTAAPWLDAMLAKLGKVIYALGAVMAFAETGAVACAWFTSVLPLMK